MKAYIDFDGRYFDGRKIWVCFYAEADFEADKLSAILQALRRPFRITSSQNIPSDPVTSHPTCHIPSYPVASHPVTHHSIPFSFHPIPSDPIPYSPIPIHPIPSHPIPSHPIPPSKPIFHLPHITRVVHLLTRPSIQPHPLTPGIQRLDFGR